MLPAGWRAACGSSSISTPTFVRTRSSTCSWKAHACSVPISSSAAAEYARRRRARRHRPETTAYALAHGIIDESVSELDALLQRGDTLVVAAPLDATLTILERCSGAPPKAALIVDVASVKAPLLPFVARLAGFVPTHPLAGAEQSGPAASRDDLFIGRPWAYVPSGDPLLEGRVLQFIRAMGAEPFAVEAERHDRIVALTPHVPQMLSTVLGATLGAREEPLLS